MTGLHQQQFGSLTSVFAEVQQGVEVLVEEKQNVQYSAIDTHGNEYTSVYTEYNHKKLKSEFWGLSGLWSFTPVKALHMSLYPPNMFISSMNRH